MYGLVRKFQFLKPTILATTLVVMLVALVPTSAQAHGPSNQDHSPSSPLNQVDSRFVDVNEGDSFVLSVKNVEIHEPTDNPNNFGNYIEFYPSPTGNSARQAGQSSSRPYLQGSNHGSGWPAA